MPAYSPKRYKPARVLRWVQAKSSTNRTTFSRAEEAWMAGRLAAAQETLDAVAPGSPPVIKRGVVHGGSAYFGEDQTAEPVVDSFS